MKKLLSGCGWLAASLVISACAPTLPEDEANKNKNGQALSYGFTMDQGDFDGLTPDEQFVAANKVLATMYRGLPADEFFDMSSGFANPTVQKEDYLSELQTALQTPMTFDERQVQDSYIYGIEDDPETPDVDESVQGRFVDFDPNHQHQIYMARALSYPISRDQFVNYMSFFLANTIMFSPAREMDSTDSQDIVRVLGYLDQQLTNEVPIRDVIRGWLHNLSRWRVSRSPENHALEMFELYLGVFNDTPEEQQNTINGGIACSNWYLTDDQGDYQLLKDLTKPEGGKIVQVFGQYVSTCDELYDVVAGHPLVIPRVTEVIVNYFLDGMDEETKLGLVEKIVSSNPVTFDDVFLGVMFSKEFMLQSERPKTFEENAFNFLGAMNWNPRYNEWNDLGRRSLDRFWDSDNNGSWVGVHNMGWAAMDYKIGRTPFVPLDVLSFANYHRAMRESIVMNNRAYDGRNFPELSDFDVYETDEEGNRIQDEEGNDILIEEATDAPYPLYDGAFYQAGTENLKETLENLNAEEFIDYVFLSAMGRRATDEETSAFIAEGLARNHLFDDTESGTVELRRGNGGPEGQEQYEYWADDFAEIMLDYMARLPEFYYFRSVGQ